MLCLKKCNRITMTVKSIKRNHPHQFHIPVMGLGFTIDTPVKVARFGISSAISIMEDELIESMRKVYYEEEGFDYVHISKKEIDHRATRITEYLNLMHLLVNNQMIRLRAEAFEPTNDVVKYFEMLADSSPIKHQYEEMLSEENPENKLRMQDALRIQLVPGSIDVNIMTKLDRINFGEDGKELPVAYSDASAALRGFALSNLNSSVVFSAGLNPRLFAYCATFNNFFPNENDELQKKITLKVSDYRSAFIQGKFLAKKGLWVSEFRIESGLNCGGHAFATEGLLMGPILEEFKNNRKELCDELFEICSNALTGLGKMSFKKQPECKITVQGGLGNATENNFLLDHYEVESIGWGSPFLLVPEATNVDDDTLQSLIKAKKENYYLSRNSSPLGVPFNNFRNSSSEVQRVERINKNRPGSPCYKKFLAFNTEFNQKTPICTASRVYQNLKIKELKEEITDPEKLNTAINDITEKECLCEGLGASALLVNNAKLSHKLSAVTICPGPNLAYFSGVFPLKEMINHIYGRSNVLNELNRNHLFVNELVIYIDYLQSEYEIQKNAITDKILKRMETFKQNLLHGIDYYSRLLPDLQLYEGKAMNQFFRNLELAKELLNKIEFRPKLIQT